MANTAAVLGNQLYGPYSNLRYNAGTMGTQKGFTGQYADALSVLDYYNARYYDPVVGYFLTADTVQANMQGMDPYTYVGDNPETHNDPTGHCWPLCTMLAGAAIGAAVSAGLSIATQVLSGHSVSWGEVGKQALIGAATGALTGLAGPEAGAAAEVATTAAESAGEATADFATEQAAAATAKAAVATTKAAATTTESTTAAVTDSTATTTEGTANTAQNALRVDNGVNPSD